ncbi:hypothetical protein MPH_00614 [Macrophomina phaseolina MS6]|uniref:Uncharacterized protein n=1 Tax=Macrophomina phaseolina (strain MS6) TaxID=1126212 RepID=K2S560_MACPH|nr:hypothetical protein MPH_00614 [Macrophomina phaseolina MS6]
MTFLQQVTEEEFREFGHKHFPGAPQPTFLPSWVTPSSNPQLSPTNNALNPATFDTAYNGGYSAGHAAGHASGHATGYNAGYSAGYGAGYAAALKDAGLEPIAAHTVGSTTHPSAPSAKVAETEEVQHEAESEGCYYEEEDLGYYPDGAVRTLSEEDVTFYRRSELMQMLKDAKRRLTERREREAEAEEINALQKHEEQEKSEDCEIQDVGNKGENEEPDAQDDTQQVAAQHIMADSGASSEEEYSGSSRVIVPKAADLSSFSSFIVAVASAPDTVHGNGRSCTPPTPPTRSTTTLVGDDSCKNPESRQGREKITTIPEANKGKKRKRMVRDTRTEDDGVTYRRIARELDEAPDVKVELDY